MLDRTNHLFHQLASITFCEVSVLDDVVEKLATWTVLHHNMDVTFVKVRLVELDNVRVVNLGHDEQFLFQVFDVLLDSFF